MKRVAVLVLNTTVTAEKAAPAQSSVLRSLTANLGGRGKSSIRWDQLEGRRHMIVPMVMLTEGVHVGSQGALLYPGDEIPKAAPVWNHKPIVVYHPQINGVGVSACDPAILNSRKVGVILNTRVDTVVVANAKPAKRSRARLKAEAWLDPEQLKVVDNRVLEALERGDMVEVSTGLWTENEGDAGEWEGERYEAIARNFKPDHLAILPDVVGACSIKDGAGLNRNQAPALNEQSYELLRQLITRALMERLGETASFWVEDVFPSFCVVSKGGKLWRWNYSASDAAVALEGEPEEVVRVTQYRTPDGEIVGNMEERAVNKLALVNAILVANAALGAGAVWVEADRPTLMNMSEKQLQALAPKAEEPKKAEPAPAPVANTAPAPTTPPVPARVPSLNEYVGNAPLEYRDVISEGVRAHAAEKTKLVQTITANQRNQFTAEELATKPMADLRKLALIAEPVQVANFLGLGEPFTPKLNGTDEEPLVAPTMNFSREGR